MAIRNIGLVILSTVTVPMGQVMAQQGFAFRPLDSTEVVEAAPVLPGWQSSSGTQAGTPTPPSGQGSGSQDSYRYAPKAPSTALPVPAYNQQTENATYPNYRYKPDESGVALSPPPPLPQAGEPVNPSASGSGYGMQQNPAQAGAPDSSRWTNPMTPPPGYPSPAGASQQGFGASFPPQGPPRLESRYIDGASLQAQSYPFRPLDDDNKPEKAVAPAQPPAPSSGMAAGYTQAPYGSAYPYPPPAGPGYYPPYGNYNSSPSFGGFRFPFSNGGFPFGFR